MSAQPTPNAPSRKFRWAIAVAACLAVVAFGVLWFGPFGRPRDPKVVTYAMPVTIAAIPAYVAAEKGFWKEEGLEVRPQMFSSGRLALDALLAGSAVLGWVGAWLASGHHLRQTRPTDL